EEGLSVLVSIEVDAQAGLDVASARGPARSDADVANDLGTPPKIARIVRVGQVVVFQRLPVFRVDVQVNFLECAVIKKRRAERRIRRTHTNDLECGRGRNRTDRS